MSYEGIELLSDDNYNVWKIKVEAHMHAKGWFDVAMLKSEPEETATEEEKEEWGKANNEALGFILQTLQSNQAAKYIDAIHAKSVWEALEVHYRRVARLKQILLFAELTKLELGPAETIDAYFVRARDIVARSKAAGKIIPEDEVVYFVVNGVVQPELAAARDVLNSWTDLTLEVAERVLTNKMASLQQARVIEDIVKVEEEGGARAAEKSVDDKRCKDRNCYTCGQPGHVAKFCRAKKTQKDEKKKANAQPEKPKKHEKVNIPVARPTLHLEELAYGPGQISSDKDWFIYTGCSSHVTPWERFLFHKVPDSTMVYLPFLKVNVQAKARGTVRITTDVGNGRLQKIDVENVLFVPELRCNLLAAHALPGLRFTGDGATVENKLGQITGVGKPRGSFIALHNLCSAQTMFGPMDYAFFNKPRADEQQNEDSDQPASRPAHLEVIALSTAPTWSAYLSPNNWFVYSRLHVSMTPYEHLLKQKVPDDTVVDLPVHNVAVQAVAKGTVHIATDIGNGRLRKLVLRDVLFVPEIRCNLLSPITVTNEAPWFDVGGSTFLDRSQQVVARGRQIGKFSALVNEK